MAVPDSECGEKREERRDRREELLNNVNKEIKKEYYQQYYQLHKESLVEYAQEYYKLHKGIMNKRARHYQESFRPQLVELLGGKCVKCGFSDKRALQIDHVNGGGHKESIIHPAQSLYRYYMRHPDLARESLQVLCANCNWIKRFEQGEVRNGKQNKT